ncbi:MAG: PAS domain S-box protein [Anaerolineae bacterium]|nr:PAS domain S-box protein [Anaerolineae bacterium]
MDSVNAATEPRQSEKAPRESEAKFRLLFDRSPNAMLLLDGDVFIDCNQAAVEMMRCSGKEQLLALHPYDISPERQPDGRLSVEGARELIDIAHQEGSLRFEWVHRRMDGQEFPAEVLLTAIPLYGRQMLHVSLRDITERKRAEKELREREAQYRGIFEASSDAVLIFDFEGTIVEANPAACRMYGYSYQELIGLCGKDIVHPDYYYLFEDYKRQIKVSGRFSAQSFDLCKDGSAINVEVHGASFSYKGKPHLLAVVRDVTEKVQARQLLERRVEERTRELQTLLDVTAAASSSLALDEMLSAALERLVALVGASRAGVMLLDGESGELKARMIRPKHPIASEDLAEVTRACDAVIASGEPLYVPLDPEKGFVEPGALLPLRVRGQALGVLVIIGSEGGAFSREQLTLFESIADQLGAAVENARLYEQAERAAVAAERSRLARDLHDAVTQTLFAASLIAEVLPRIWERDPGEGRRRLDELRELTRGALAEMRTLLLELRPSALAEARLGDLLRQLAESITGRVRVPVSVEVEGECALPPEVKVALYRIAQEALNNVAKHAGASQAAVSLRYLSPHPSPTRGGEGVELRIRDDGRGFDLESVPPESLGLGIMRERAEAIGTVLNIDSQVGHGTEVVVAWKDRRGGKQ